MSDFYVAHAAIEVVPLELWSHRSVSEMQHLMAEKPLTEWNSGLCDCFEDTSSCKTKHMKTDIPQIKSCLDASVSVFMCFPGCYGFWCSPCLACSVSGRFGENYCLPLCDIFSPALAVVCDIPLFAPPAALSLRSAMRNKYGIKVWHETLTHAETQVVKQGCECDFMFSGFSV